jgi:hypothetical protein
LKHKQHKLLSFLESNTFSSKNKTDYLPWIYGLLDIRIMNNEI